MGADGLLLGPELEIDWEGRPLADLQRHIISNHHDFTRQTLQTIVLLAAKVADRHGERHPETLDVHRLVCELSEELLPHMVREETVLFPYIEALENGGLRDVSSGVAERPMRAAIFHHERASETLASIRRGTREYTLPADACLSFRALYERLADLEKDLQQHMNLENNTLFPRALLLEQWATREPGE